MEPSEPWWEVQMPNERQTLREYLLETEDPSFGKAPPDKVFKPYPDGTSSDGKQMWSIGPGISFGTTKPKPMTKAELEPLFDKKLDEHVTRAKETVGEDVWGRLNDSAKKHVAAETYRGLLPQSPNTVRLIKEGKFDEAADEYMKNKDFAKGGNIPGRIRGLSNSLKDQVNKPELERADMPKQTSGFLGFSGFGDVAEEEKAKSKSLLDKVNAEPTAAPVAAKPKPAAVEEPVPTPTPESKKAVAEVDQAVKSNPMETIDRLEANIPSGKLSSADRKAYQDRIAELRSLSQQAEDRLAKGELIETLSNAITQFAAAMYGNKHGVDMSGLKFNKTDWDAKIDRSIAKFRDQIKSIEQEQVGAERSAEREQDVAFRKEGLKAQLAEAARRAKDQEKGRELQARGLDISEGKIQGAQQAKAAEQQQKMSKQIDAILAAPEDKKDDDQKAKELSLLLGREITPEQVATKDPGWFLGLFGAEPRTALQAKQEIMGTQAAKDPDAEKYAKTYNIPYEQAKAIVDQRKGR